MAENGSSTLPSANWLSTRNEHRPDQKDRKMIVISSYTTAVLMCVVTMLCWGSWANTQKLASKEWEFPLFYWDYSLGVLLFSLLLAFTMGSMGDHGRPFLADLSQASHQAIMSALIGGIVFNLANILLVAAIWGVFIWKEFKGAPAGVNKLLTFMFLFYIIGLALIILSRN